ncbi:MAG: putative quinol monooxygenase [Chloracidobacterium sp.]|uniref:Antibiotic biosynthesis monooxygenase n=1 Tax=Chloracidobacterium validum TaxID=2821543 RepID=A0ABX8BCF1_9BACT|nr:putative quinol monooxygenase [Chloracidobacterium validum]QUW04384.1 antibiotic biosynthesis monooxygenase [Chloracidobacterium validum]
MSVPVTVLAHFRAKPEHLADVQTALAELIAATRQEAGCLSYVLHVAQDDPTAFVMIERWASPEALKAHFAQPHTQAALARIPPWLAEDVRISRWTEVELTRPEPV